jgi:hypothetical protein
MASSAADELARVFALPERMDRQEVLLQQLVDQVGALLAATPTAMDNAEQAAQRHNVTPATIRRWCAAGLLPGAKRTGRAWRIPMNATVTPDDDEIQRLADEARGRR